MSEAIAEVKDKAKGSLDELCSMVEKLLVSTAQWARKFTKVQAKKLVKSNKSKIWQF